MTSRWLFSQKKPTLWILDKVLITPSCCSCVFIENMFDSWVMVEHLTKVFVRSEKSRKIHWKSPALEPLFNVTWFQLESSLKKDLGTCIFLWILRNFSGQVFCSMPKGGSVFLQNAKNLSVLSLFFSTYPQCCFTFSWIELQMLLRCCLIHITIIILRQFIFSTFVSMPWPGSTYFISIFHFQHHFHRH